MRIPTITVVRTIITCSLFLVQLSLGQERVFKATASTSTDGFHRFANAGNTVKGVIIGRDVCNDYFDIGGYSCALAIATPQNSFTVYRTEVIDAKLDDLGTKVNSLNKRIVDDEAALPGQIDQFAAQQLLEKLDALDARVKALEKQIEARKQ